jgi:hypothetical protein
MLDSGQALAARVAAGPAVDVGDRVRAGFRVEEVIRRSGGVAEST